MVQSNWLTPFAQVSRELGFELRLAFRESRLASFGKRDRMPAPPILPEQRIDDLQIVQQRKADAFLQSVRHGAVRR